MHYPRKLSGEYACRAGTTTAYSWGDTISFGDANYAYNGNGTGLQQTTDVGQYPPNPWGFYDMHGNLWEITSGGSLLGGLSNNGPRPIRTSPARRAPTVPVGEAPGESTVF